jgi:V8-like Glu-specific endopeptidase
MIVGGGGFKIRSALANNKARQDEEISGTPGSFPLNPSIPIRNSKIYGHDNREPLTDTSYPFSTVGLIESGDKRCTGTLVGPRHVLTASHCIDYKGDNGFKPTTFAPAYNKGDAPFGTFKVVKMYWLLNNGETLTDFDTAFDYAVFVLDRSPKTGFMCTKTYKRAWKDIPKWNNIGYPGDKFKGEAPVFSDNNFILSHQPYRMDAPSARFPGVGKVEGYIIRSKFDTKAGQSGGPLYADFPGDGPCVIAVASTTANAGGYSSLSDDRNGLGGGPALTFLVKWALEHSP